MFPLKPIVEDLSSPPSSCGWLASNIRHSLACSCSTSVSASLLPWFPPTVSRSVIKCPSSYGTNSTGLRAHPTPVRPCPNKSPLPSQIRPHSEGPGVETSIFILREQNSTNNRHFVINQVILYACACFWTFYYIPGLSFFLLDYFYILMP